ncbi:hypothetical protein CYMTET_17904 [Cymbomonas tetramitiformis]|uniref:SAM-dependent MTase RsmB/NOP-type domain-containing protein n=1 Tax=Cymbomonas tetramitiformis TaxID=36881 RepID=A0AAE0G9I3_9CHLO|nr:hypothetical protein CYMTET_17904 [Cymbomonas tetramitiformis]
MTQGRPFLHDAVQTRVDGLTVFKPVYFGWCGAWQLGCDDRLIRQASKQDKTSHLAQLQRWIAQHTANGVITRQEIVSMAPVALLQIKPEHRVLDVCASPGSKTTQALEALHASEEHSPRGFVVANELVDKRSYLLSNRCAALGSACRRLMVTSHRAQIFPQFDKSCAGEYDRIICDVPCSGDGTFRKYRDKWGHWLPHMGRGLHSLQLQIAIRAIGLLKVGGLMTYSTCSFNPLENEAVVAALLARGTGAIELVPASHLLQGFDARPGLSTWVVMDENLNALPSYDAALRALPKARHCRFRDSMWPPQAGTSDMHLDRCLRLYPHLMNTGGFFIALLRKTGQWPPPPQRAHDGHASAGGPGTVAASTSVPRTFAPHLPYLPASQVVVDEVCCKLRLNPDRLQKVGVLHARGDRRLFLLSAELAQHLAQGGADSGSKRHVTTISAGVCVVYRDPAQGGRWQVTPQGAGILYPCAKKDARLSLPVNPTMKVLEKPFIRVPLEAGVSSTTSQEGPVIVKVTRGDAAEAVGYFPAILSAPVRASDETGIMACLEGAHAKKLYEIVMQYAP